MTKKLTGMQEFERDVKQGLYHFEPLLMLYLDHQWVHPLIDYEMKSTGTFHRIWIHFGDKTTATLVVTSRMLDEYWRMHPTAKRENIKGTAWPEKRKPTELEHIEGMVETCLTEDTWNPGICLVEGTWRGGEQFCFSEFGKVLSQAFSKGPWSIEISRSEIGSITLEDDGYTFVTDKEMAAQARMASQH